MLEAKKTYSTTYVTNNNLLQGWVDEPMSKMYFDMTYTWLINFHSSDNQNLEKFELRSTRDIPECTLHCKPFLTFKSASFPTQTFIIGRVLLLRNTHWQNIAHFDSPLSHLGKGWIVRGTTTKTLLYWANGLFYPGWNMLYRFTAYRQQCGRLPVTDRTCNLGNKLMALFYADFICDV